jgi:predicted dinucleotide-binding enzyme
MSRRRCRAGKARPSSTRRTCSRPLKSWTDLPSSAFVAKAFTGAKLVKGFNHLIAATLAADPVVEGGHRVVFLSSDDEDAIAPVAALAKQLGFAPVKLGSSTRVARWCTHAAALGAR